LPSAFGCRQAQYAFDFDGQGTLNGGTVTVDGKLMFHKVTWKHCHECLHGLR